jgi:glycosyltransferase involved in cell wall biosynthesis
MSNDFQVGVIIATSFQRTELLFGRALKSVIKQTYPPDFIIIIDDNQNKDEFDIISDRLKSISISNIFCIRNFKTKNYSASGACNSGVDFLCKKFKNNHGYIAILDDDDEWSYTYLKKCSDRIKLRGVEKTRAVFSNLVRLHNDCNIYCNLKREELTIENFLIGNPGVQGSNMFFRLDAFMATGGFDETLKSCTDRDLMIRFLKYHPVEYIALVNETLVYHHARSTDCVTGIPSIKWAGLDRFYDKYICLYTTDTLEKSLRRAEKYFEYPNRNMVLDRYNSVFS